MKACLEDHLCDHFDSDETKDGISDNGVVTMCSDNLDKKIDPVKIYTRDRDGDTLLHIAVILMASKCIKLFISKAPICKWLSLKNMLFQTPLHLAAITNQPEVTKELVAAGAEVELRDREGNTALHIACREGFQRIVECLLEPVQATRCNDNSPRNQKIPQDFSIRNYEGVTVLHLAAANRHYGIIDVLINKEIDVNMKEGKTGRTVLHNACLSGDITLVKVLLQQRFCNLNARAYDGSTPFDLARARGHDMVCMTLAAAGARYGDDDSDSEE
ncbi:NF-kappa-B inhibitor epsilon-like [Mercenaria mercenaria]|uniref:NF-kappa-B inhibitor epsilon-like n=1 Tax=Mercenaria mercenaria TaxID=6596 RepID=UPI00234F2C04|nr:NF-kappa-B inhibitor epsilon-like [Mercenaria mercenaria]